MRKLLMRQNRLTNYVIFLTPNFSQNPLLVVICTVTHQSLLRAQPFATIATFILKPSWKVDTLHVHSSPTLCEKIMGSKARRVH